MIIEPKDFSKDEIKGYQFGCADRETICAGLTKLLRALASGHILIQKVSFSSQIGLDDYLMNTISFTYAETTEQSPESERISDDRLWELYASHSSDVRK